MPSNHYPGPSPVAVSRARFLDIVDGRVPKSQMTMMRDISLRGRSDVPQERVVNKLQGWVWDDVLSQFVLLPQVSPPPPSPPPPSTRHRRRRCRV